MLILIVAGGPDKGRIYELHENEPVVLGREGEPIRLNDRKCSRKHARVWCEGGKWYVRDLNSRHGTFINATQIENKHELEDGDHIQVGSTLFVLARMTAEHAERAALLGEPLQSGRGPLARIGRPVLLGGAAAAAALIIASNVMIYLSSNEQSRRLAEEIASARTQTASTADQLLQAVRGGDAQGEEAETQQTLREILAAVQAQREQEKVLADIAEAMKSQPEQAAMLRDVLAKLDAQPGTEARTQEMLAAVLERIEAQPGMQEKTQQMLAAVIERLESRPQGDPEAREMLAGVLERLDAQPGMQAKTQQMLAAVMERVESQPVVDLRPLMAEVREAADAARQQQQALAARVERQDSLLRDSLAQLKAPATLEPALVKSLRETLEGNADNAELLKRVVAHLEGQKALAGELAALRKAIEQQPEATRLALREAVQSMPNAGGRGMSEAVEEIKRVLPRDVTAKLDRVLARLDEPQVSPEQLADALRAVIEENQAGTAEALQRVSSRLDTQPTREDMLAALHEAAAAPADRVLARLDEVAGSQPTAEQIAEALAATQRQPDPALMASLDAIVAELGATRVAALEAGDDAATLALAETSRKTQQMLEDVLAEVRNREPIEGLRSQVQALAEAQGSDQSNALDRVMAALDERRAGDAEARLAELVDLLQSWPQQTEAMLKEMVGALAKANEPGSAQIDQVLAEIRERTMGRFEELDQAIRNDLRMALAQEMATPSQPAENPRRGRTRSAVLNAAGGDSISAETGLSPTEEAYKVAFETGKPVTLGAGVVNAVTGAVSEGRTLDPAAARAAGIKDWREWYTLDDFAERMRLQKQRLRFEGEGPKRHDVITLPSNTPGNAGAQGADGTVSHASRYEAR